jgi:hypothetical protein
MELLNTMAWVKEAYRGDEIGTQTLESQNRGEHPLVSTPSAAVNMSENTKLDEEREEKLQLWMEEVKAFIRNIDVNNL